MTFGHGDDLYHYPGIQHNFSSNIYAHADLSLLYEHLSRRLQLIGSYPPPESTAVEVMLAEQHGISADSVLVTNGATDAIYLAAQAFSSPFPHYALWQPTFSEYADASRLAGMTPVSGGTEESKRTVFWLCNPNNPTGTVCSPDTVRQLSEHYALLVLDQSYEDYTLAQLMTPREAIEQGNIIQLHSFTKTYAIPGLRIGYVVAAPQLMASLRRYLRPWSVNALAVDAALWLLTHPLPAVPDRVAYLAEAQELYRKLNAIEGITVTPTQTNFMLASLQPSATVAPSLTAAELKERLAVHHHILIRDASNFDGLTPFHFRIAAQLPAENQLLVEAIERELLKSQHPKR